MTWLFYSFYIEVTVDDPSIAFLEDINDGGDSKDSLLL